MVLTCPGCGCPFYADQIPPDYAEDTFLEAGRVPYYLHQGAGLSLITRPLAQLHAPKGSTYIEVGCGFGFGLDYARHAKGWLASGIDPAGIAALGHQSLGVAIERRYLGDTERSLESRCDIVMATETIEHVRSPKAFVHVLRTMLRPNGTLVLTTPDGADLRPETSPAVLIGLLSPGSHLIFQTRESLRHILAEAGFGHVLINKDGHSLVAFASDHPIDLEPDDKVLRADYRAYLESRSRNFPPDHDLFLGFAGRAFQEAVNDAAFDQARALHQSLDQSCRVRFGTSLDDLGRRTAEWHGASLDDLAHHMPLSLGGLLYAGAILRLASGASRASQAASFLHAAAAADLLRDALANLTAADGMSEEIAWTARAEAVLCAAAAGEGDILTRLSALPSAPDAEHGASRREVIVERSVVELVNAGHYGLADQLVDAGGLNDKAWADPAMTMARSASQRDALFCLAVLDCRHDEPAVIERGRLRFHRVQHLLEYADAPDGLLAAAINGEATCHERLRHGAAASAAGGATSWHVAG